MQIKTALKRIILISVFLFLFPFNIFAQFGDFVTDQLNVNIQASINVDLHSQILLNPPTVEVLQPSAVIVSTLNPGGSPKPGRMIQLYVEGDSTGISIIQPTTVTDSNGSTVGFVTSTIPGTYMICARDITESMVIDIKECKALYVTPVPAPTMLELPQYTRGDSCNVMWNMSGIWVYEYYVEVSLTPSFESVLYSSGWIDDRSYQFDNLENERMYFYRVKARNSYGGESKWSNIVFSVQDSQPPLIELINITEMDGDTTEEWNSNFVVNIQYRITDNIGVSKMIFWCLDRKGQKLNCRHTMVVDGDFLTVSIKLSDLERFNLIYLYKEYGFCIEAVDLVGNVSRNCNALLKIPFKIRRPMRSLDDSFDIIVESIKPETLQDLSLSMSLINISFSLATLLLAFGYFPYLIVQLILSLQTLFGIRRITKTGGYVYDSFTKEPVSQALVRLFDLENNILWWDMTDRNGYYLLPNLKEGSYRMDVVSRYYTFPSKVVVGRTDFPLENIYHGREFEIKEGVIPNFAIPIDERDLNKFERSVGRFLSRTKGVWKFFHFLLFVVGFLLSIYVLQVANVWWNYLIIVTYIFAGIILFLNLFNRKDRYGVVLDEEEEIVEGAMVSLTDVSTGKLIATRVTDRLGRYRFAVEKGIYVLGVLNSNLRLVNEEEVMGIEVKKERGDILTNRILIRRLEDSTEVEELMEPLKEL